MSLRVEIKETIFEHPGLHFRELQRRLRLGSGSLAYHLGILQREGVVREEKLGVYLRFYATELSSDHVRLIGTLRVNSFRRIILYVMTHPGSNHSMITRSVKLSPSTVSWHLRKLQNLGIIKHNPFEKSYIVFEPEKVAEILKNYKESFSDRLVNRFYVMWGI